ncbi:MAG: EamA family transporter [Candidatus Tectomicrobia bacterium]|nr:EamA family transporter [Candidatus Tectomicrobia bacterium]
MMKYLFAFLAALSWGLSPNFAKLGVNLGGAAAVGALMAPIVSMPVFYLMLRLLGLRLTPWGYTWQAYAAIAGSGVCSILGTYFYWKGLSYGQVSVIVPLNSTYPLVTLFLVMLFLREERITGRILIGTCLTILGGVLVVL